MTDKIVKINKIEQIKISFLDLKRIKGIDLISERKNVGIIELINLVKVDVVVFGEHIVN